MKLYAEAPRLRTRQLLTDAAVALWVLLWVRFGFLVDALVNRLAEPSRSLESAGVAFGRRLDAAGAEVADVPAIGDALEQPFSEAATAGRELARVAQAQQRDISTLALVISLIVAGFAIVYVLGRYLPSRVRWMRAATAASRLRLDSDDLYIFALRAIATRPWHELRRVTPDPAGAFSAGDYEALAALELSALGLRTDAAFAARRT